MAMKRTLCALACILFLSGCSGQHEQSPISESETTTTASEQTKATTTEAPTTTAATEADKTKPTKSEPKSFRLNDVIYDNGEISLTYKGLDTTRNRTNVYIKFDVVNNSDYDISVALLEGSVNGYILDFVNGNDIPCKKKGRIEVWIEKDKLKNYDIEVNGIDTLEGLMWIYRYYEEDERPNSFTDIFNYMDEKIVINVK